MNQLFCLIYINTTVSKILLFDAPVDIVKWKQFLFNCHICVYTSNENS